jgi:hypothetical protein
MAKTADRMRPGQNYLTLVKGRDIGYVCQYTTMREVGRELNRIEKFYQMFLRTYPALKRRIGKWFGKCHKKSDRAPSGEVIANKFLTEDSLGDGLKIGDMVKVLSYSQIESTLNDKGYLKGLSFQKSMQKYCNSTYQVLKLPKYVLDQGGRKINRCKDVVILRGLYCNGKDAMEKEGCDRCCLHYWKSDWLRKVV